MKGREYRKGNWTLQETMVLIEAKKMSSNRPSEFRWKWVEDYCWRNGCNRSKNQCNDKWDNLMRDYKKVRCHENGGGYDGGGGSYWKLEAHERKEKNFPSNFLSQIYEALAEVVERKCPVLPTSNCEESHEVVVLDDAISKSAFILAEVIIASDDKEESRHEDVLRMRDRKMRVEESKAEISTQSMGGLSTAIGKLATSVFGLVSSKE